MAAIIGNNCNYNYLFNNNKFVKFVKNNISLIRSYQYNDHLKYNKQYINIYQFYYNFFFNIEFC